MTTANLSSVSSRIEKVSEMTKISVKDLTDSLLVLGVETDDEGLQLLNSIPADDILDTMLQNIKKDIPILKKKAAIAILHGWDPFAKSEEKTKPSSESNITSTIVESIKAMRSIKELKDKDLLELYNKERDYEVEQEIHRRANHQAFIVLEQGDQTPGKEKINIEASLDLLKIARKGKTPEMIPVGDSIFPTYKITELNITERIVEICPICGETLYKGYCTKCQVNLSSIGDDERAFMKLVLDDGSLNRTVYADRTAIIELAKAGLEQLKATWPKTSKKFDELKITNSLPKVRILKSTPSTMADPFYRSNGNNKTF